MFFKDVIGQEEIKKKLIQTVQDGRISHAQLFAGPEGSGSLAMALAYAQFISCTDKRESDSCGVCPSCNKYLKLIHPDLHFVFPVNTTEAVTKKEPVSDDFIFKWREMLLEDPYPTLFGWYDQIGIENKQGIINVRESAEIIRKLNLKTFESDYKIMIIWLPEKMNLASANKLLKILEEPYENTVFMLVTESPGQIIPTILSRTQILKIPAIEPGPMSDALKKMFDMADGEIQDAVRLSEGNYNKAVEYIQKSEETEVNFERFGSIMRLAYSRNIKGILDWIDQMSTLGREKQKNFLVYSIRMIRENYMMNMGNVELVRMSAKEKEFASKFSAFIHHNNASLIAEEFNKACIHIEANAYDKIVFLDMAMRLIKLIRQVPG
jgi:DNA polymerase III subunit delta'